MIEIYLYAMLNVSVTLFKQMFEIDLQVALSVIHLFRRAVAEFHTTFYLIFIRLHFDSYFNKV